MLTPFIQLYVSLDVNYQIFRFTTFLSRISLKTFSVRFCFYVRLLRLLQEVITLFLPAVCLPNNF